MTEEIQMKYSRAAKAKNTVVCVGNARIGGGHFAVIAGPCAVESREQLFAAAAGILKDEQRLEEMSQNMASLGVRDATERIYECVMSLLK